MRFRRLTPIEYLSGSRWRCSCECGKVTIVKTGSLTSGNTKSCGCLRVDSSKISRSKGHNLRSHPLYTVHICMIHRCTNKDRKQYKDYGGRGIKVCDEWLNKENGLRNFIKWAESNGYKKGLEIDRENNDGNYDPSNCRFVTRRENVLNRRIPLNNKSGYAGVNWHKTKLKWGSSITVRGVQNHLGYHSTKEEALKARNNYIVDRDLGHEYKIQEWDY